MWRWQLGQPTLLVAAIGAGLLVWTAYQAGASGRASLARRPRETPLPGVYSAAQQQVVQRSLLHYPAGDCLVLHHPPIAKPPGTPTARLQPWQEDTAWGRVALRTPNVFNCCAYAVGRDVGLRPTDWLPGDRPEEAPANPMQVVLDSFYRPVAEYRLASVRPYARFEADSTLREGDVVCFVKTESGEHVHAGRIHAGPDGRNLVVSKFGGGPLVLCAADAVQDYFPGFDVLHVYRHVPGHGSP